MLKELIVYALCRLLNFQVYSFTLEAQLNNIMIRSTILLFLNLFHKIQKFLHAGLVFTVSAVLNFCPKAGGCL